MALNEMHKSAKRYEVGRVLGGEDAMQRKLKLILNKITPQNLNIHFKQVREASTMETFSLSDFVLQIVRRAVAEEVYCEMYIC